MAIAGKVAILPKGEWDSAVTYEKLDAVSYDNALYIAKKPSVGQVPTDGEYWMFCLQSIDYAEFEKIINGTTTVGIADKAINDKNGDDIVDTYAKKDDLTNFQNKDGDSKDNIVTFTSADDTTADAWTDVAVLATDEKHSSLFAKISTMFKNIRYIYTHFIKSENILDTLEEIVANTQSGKVAGALAVKELNSNLNLLNKNEGVILPGNDREINFNPGEYFEITVIGNINRMCKIIGQFRSNGTPDYWVDKPSESTIQVSSNTNKIIIGNPSGFGSVDVYSKRFNM